MFVPQVCLLLGWKEDTLELLPSAARFGDVDGANNQECGVPASLDERLCAVTLTRGDSNLDSVDTLVALTDPFFPSWW